jgi:hypothetical protein
MPRQDLEYGHPLPDSEAFARERLKGGKGDTKEGMSVPGFDGGLGTILGRFRTGE